MSEREMHGDTPVVHAPNLFARHVLERVASISIESDNDQVFAAAVDTGSVGAKVPHKSYEDFSAATAILLEQLEKSRTDKDDVAPLNTTSERALELALYRGRHTFTPQTILAYERITLLPHAEQLKGRIMPVVMSKFYDNIIQAIPGEESTKIFLDSVAHFWGEAATLPEAELPSRHLGFLAGRMARHFESLKIGEPDVFDIQDRGGRYDLRERTATNMSSNRDRPGYSRADLQQFLAARTFRYARSGNTYQDFSLNAKTTWNESFDDMYKESLERMATPSDDLLYQVGGLRRLLTEIRDDDATVARLPNGWTTYAHRAAKAVGMALKLESTKDAFQSTDHSTSASKFIKALMEQKYKNVYRNPSADTLRRMVVQDPVKDLSMDHMVWLGDIAHIIQGNKVKTSSDNPESVRDAVMAITAVTRDKSRMHLIGPKNSLNTDLWAIARRYAEIAVKKAKASNGLSP